jgi:hypothetical protein
MHMNTLTIATLWMLLGGQFTDGLDKPNVGEVGLGVYSTLDDCEKAAEVVMTKHRSERAVCIEGKVAK